MTMRKDEHAAVGNMYVGTYDVRVYQILKDVLYQTMYSHLSNEQIWFSTVPKLQPETSGPVDNQIYSFDIHFLAQQSERTRCNNRPGCNE